MMTELSEYVAGALQRPLPPHVTEKSAHHILDTLAAIVSGARMAPGRAGARLAASLPGAEEATVLAADQRADVLRAALANGMAAHADETDDSHEISLTHPGCAIVPAALAVAEREDSTGLQLVAAVTLGYDVGTRLPRALWPDNHTMRTQGTSTHAIGGLFGAACASGALMGLDAEQVRYMLSFAAQEASGLRTWTRDVEHVEKAYVYGGMPAQTGVWVALLAAAGWPGVRDVFSGTPNMLDILGTDPDPSVLTHELGSRYEVLATNIKRFSVGSPIQAPLDALLTIVEREGFAAEEVGSASVRLPALLARVVDDRDMPNINLQYLVTVALQDREVSFAAAHDDERFGRWRRSADLPVEVVRDPDMAPIRQAVTTIRLRDGREFEEHVTAVRGTADNQMTRGEVEAKAADLVRGVVGEQRTAKLLELSRTLDGLPSCRELGALLAAG